MKELHKNEKIKILTTASELLQTKKANTLCKAYYLALFEHPELNEVRKWVYENYYSVGLTESALLLHIPEIEIYKPLRLILANVQNAYWFDKENVEMRINAIDYVLNKLTQK